jgi:hypothetical protein
MRTDDRVVIPPVTLVPCEVCRHEILLSEALPAEATEYVAYFCGLDCFHRWRGKPADIGRV